jgi:hypothetical protein
MVDFSEQNIYQMWFESQGATDGLWITRTTWSSIVARIVFIGEPKGPPPYYGNPIVLADIFNVDGSIRERRAKITAAGTYKTYRRIQPPSWAGSSR